MTVTMRMWKLLFDRNENNIQSYTNTQRKNSKMLLQKLSFKTPTKWSCCQWPALHGPIRAQNPDGFNQSIVRILRCILLHNNTATRRTYLSRHNNNNTDQTDPSHGLATAQPAQLLPWFHGPQTQPHSNAQLGRTMASVGAAWQRIPVAHFCLSSMFDKSPWGKHNAMMQKTAHKWLSLLYDTTMYALDSIESQIDYNREQWLQSLQSLYFSYADYLIRYIYFFLPILWQSIYHHIDNFGQSAVCKTHACINSAGSFDFLCWHADTEPGWSCDLRGQPNKKKKRRTASSSPFF